MAKVAFLTTGILHAPYGDPKVRGFEERIDAVFAGAERCTGFLGFPEPFGDETPIMFRTPEYAHRYATTITTWQDLESVFAFCLGCKIFAVLMRMGVVPDKVCERCNDIWSGAPAPAR